MQGINFGFSYFWASTLGFSNSGHQLWYFLQNFSDFFRGINFCSYLYKSFFPKLGLNWPTQRQLLHPSVNCYLTDYDSNMKSANTRGFFKDFFFFVPGIRGTFLPNACVSHVRKARASRAGISPENNSRRCVLHHRSYGEGAQNLLCAFPLCLLV